MLGALAMRLNTKNKGVLICAARWGETDRACN